MQLTNDRPVPVRSVHAKRPAALHPVPGLHPSAESEGSRTQRNRRRHDRRRRSVTTHTNIINIVENTGSIQPSSIPNRFLVGFDYNVQIFTADPSLYPLALWGQYNKGRHFASQLCPMSTVHYQTTFERI